LHLKNFELDASADSLILENDKDLKIFRKIINRYDTKKFVVITYKPNKDLFSQDSFKNIKDFPTKFEPKYKPLLNDEALVTFEKEQGIRLSHYNLLVNVNSIQKALSIKSRTRYKSSLEPRSTAWVVLQAILPIYCGCIYDTVNPDFTIGETGNDFNLRYDLKNMSEFSKTDIAICPENSAGLCLEGLPVHLTDFSLDNGNLKLQGHSVMMGYLDDSENESSFRNKALYIPV